MNVYSDGSCQVGVHTSGADTSKNGIKRSFNSFQAQRFFSPIHNSWTFVEALPLNKEWEQFPLWHSCLAQSTLDDVMFCKPFAYVMDFNSAPSPSWAAAPQRTYQSYSAKVRRRRLYNLRCGQHSEAAFTSTRLWRTGVPHPHLHSRRWQDT